jgi:class 3 adenylate cyclase
MYSKNKTFTLTDGHSSITGQKVDVVVLYADIRGFSNWSMTQTAENVASLVKIEYERVIQICNDHHPCFHKFLGDGFLLLWEKDEELSTDDCFRHALDAAFHAHKAYFYASQELSRSFALPAGMGIGISLGEAVRIQPETFLEEMNEVDFLGYPMNCGARMQSFSNAYGTTLCSSCVGLVKSNPESFLYPTVPSFRRALVPPSKNTRKKAEDINGLNHSDRTEFSHLVWLDAPFLSLAV